jgi:hypothetical protein
VRQCPEQFYKYPCDQLRTGVAGAETMLLKKDTHLREYDARLEMLTTEGVFLSKIETVACSSGESCSCASSMLRTLSLSEPPKMSPGLGRNAGVVALAGCSASDGVAATSNSARLSTAVAEALRIFWSKGSACSRG